MIKLERPNISPVILIVEKRMFFTNPLYTIMKYFFSIIGYLLAAGKTNLFQIIRLFSYRDSDIFLVLHLKKSDQSENCWFFNNASFDIWISGFAIYVVVSTYHACLFCGLSFDNGRSQAKTRFGPVNLLKAGSYAEVNI